MKLLLSLFVVAIYAKLSYAEETEDDGKIHTRLTCEVMAKGNKVEEKEDKDEKYQFFTLDMLKNAITKETLSMPNDATKDGLVQKIHESLLNYTCSDGSDRDADAICENVTSWLDQQSTDALTLWQCYMGIITGDNTNGQYYMHAELDRGESMVVYLPHVVTKDDGDK